MFLPGIILSAALLLGGCTAGSSAISESLRLLAPGKAEADAAALRPDVRYLRAETDGHVALLALGYIEPHPQGQVEVWYSGDGEVLRLQNGRIVGTAGLRTDWRDVRLPALPRWGEIKHPVRYVRSRDEMPGYRANVREVVVLQPIAAPAHSSLRRLDAMALHWFEESLDPPRSDIAPARFAVDRREGIEDVVYSEQCLAPRLCIALQRWPATAGGPR